MSHEETRTVQSFRFSITQIGMRPEAFLVKRGVREDQVGLYLKGIVPFKPIWYRHVQDKLERRIALHQATL